MSDHEYEEGDESHPYEDGDDAPAAGAAATGGGAEGGGGADPPVKTKSKRKRKRVRKRKHETWKPYSQLTWEEKRALEERDSRRPEIHIPELPKAPDGSIPDDVPIGDYRPPAPRNTTADLIERHLKDESDGEAGTLQHQEEETQEQIENLLLEGTGSNADLIRSKRVKTSASHGWPASVRQSPRRSPSVRSGSVGPAGASQQQSSSSAYYAMDPPAPRPRKPARIDSLFSNADLAELARELRSPSSSALHPPPNYRKR